MEIIFEVVFGFFGELVLQLLGEILMEFGLHSVAEPFRRKPSPWLAAIGYALLGAAIGGLSLLVFPDYLVASKGLRITNVALSPIVAGLSMAALGAWRARRGQAVLRIDKFSYGYLFALGFALVRFWFASPG
ncbi:MAG: hypothetical protein V4858_17525 [Pseudomonadota bacterium]